MSDSPGWLGGGRAVRLLALLLAAAAAIAVHLGRPAAHLAAERVAHDLRIALSPRVAEEQRIVVVDIDERSLAALGPWPWPRQRIANLVDTLAGRYAAGLIGLDIVFPEARADDELLRASLQRAPAVLAQVFDPLLHSDNRAGELADPLPPPPAPWPPTTEAGGYIANHPTLLFTGAQAGHITPTLDVDGKVRRLQAISCHRGHCAATLGLRMYMALTGAQSLDMGAGGWSAATLRLQPDAGLELPVDARGEILLPYRLAPEAIRYISAADVLSGQAPPELLRNALVLVGSTALGLGDRVATPLASLAPGVAVHVEMLATLLDHTPARELAEPGGILLAAGLGWTLLLLWWTRQDMHPWRLIGWALGGSVLWGMANWLLWRELFWAVPVWPVWIFLMLAFALLAPLENRRAWKQLGGLVRQVSSYIPAPVVQRLLREPPRSAGLDAERRVLTVLFADLRGFTTLAEQSSPERVALLVQKLLSELSAVVVGKGGTVEKFTGDGLMAIWGAPMPDAEQAAHALAAGVELQETMQAMRPWFAAHDFPPMALGVGINTGEAVVGIYGNASHRAYTAHGDAVNVGERIQRLTRETGIPLLLGEATARQLPEGCCRHVGEYAVAGRQGSVAVWCRAADWRPQSARTV